MTLTILNMENVQMGEMEKSSLHWDLNQEPSPYEADTPPFAKRNLISTIG